MQHGADAEVPAAGVGALAGEDVGAGDGVGVGRLGAGEVARDVAAAEVERLLQHGSHRHGWHDDCQLEAPLGCLLRRRRSEEHTSELQSHYSISYAVFCLDRHV